MKRILVFLRVVQQRRIKRIVVNVATCVAKAQTDITFLGLNRFFFTVIKDIAKYGDIIQSKKNINFL